MILGVPRERVAKEHRVALTPAGARSLVHQGNVVVIESGAGRAARFAGRGGSSASARGPGHPRLPPPRSRLQEPPRGPSAPRRHADRIGDPGGLPRRRADVHAVVTEYGVARLHGLSLRRRAAALIAIAHPDFREALTEHAVARHLLDGSASREAMVGGY